MNTFLLLALFWFILFGAVCGSIAQNKRLCAPLWFFVGGVLGIIGLLIVLVVPAGPAVAAETALDAPRPRAASTQICPHCQTKVGIGWKHCPGCQQPLPELKSWDQAVNGADEVEQWARQNPGS